MAQGRCTLALRVSQSFVCRELTGRVITVVFTVTLQSQLMHVRVCSPDLSSFVLDPSCEMVELKFLFIAGARLLTVFWGTCCHECILRVADTQRPSAAIFSSGLWFCRARFCVSNSSRCDDSDLTQDPSKRKANAVPSDTSYSSNSFASSSYSLHEARLASFAVQRNFPAPCTSHVRTISSDSTSIKDRYRWCLMLLNPRSSAMSLVCI